LLGAGGRDEGVVGERLRDEMDGLSKGFTDEEVSIVNRWSAEFAASYRDVPPPECECHNLFEYCDACRDRRAETPAEITGLDGNGKAVRLTERHEGEKVGFTGAETA
jgi:hypothetical protein